LVLRAPGIDDGMLGSARDRFEGDIGPHGSHGTTGGLTNEVGVPTDGVRVGLVHR